MNSKIKLITIISLALGLFAFKSNSQTSATSFDPYYINDTVTVNQNVNRVRKIYSNGKVGNYVPLKLAKGTKITSDGIDNGKYYLFVNMIKPLPYDYGLPIRESSGNYAKEVYRDNHEIKQNGFKVIAKKYNYHPSYAKQYQDYRNHSNPRYAKAIGMARYQTLVDINRDRKKYHVQPLKENRRDLDQIASLRAWQVYYHLSHYDKKGRPMIHDDAHKLGFNTYDDYQSEGENISNAYVTKNETGQAMANHANNILMDHDWDPYGYPAHNGHRKDILYKAHKSVGIGVYIGNDHDKRGRNLVSIVEDFEG